VIGGEEQAACVIIKHQVRFNTRVIQLEVCPRILEKEDPAKVHDKSVRCARDGDSDLHIRCAEQAVDVTVAEETTRNGIEGLHG
jgi:hypothetical protein